MKLETRSEIETILEEHLGKQTMQKTRQAVAKEVAAERREICEEIEQIRSDCEKQVAELLPQAKAAKGEQEKAMGRLHRVSNKHNMLRRKLASVNESSSRKIEGLKKRLRATASREIDRFVEHTREVEAEILKREVQFDRKPTGREGRRGKIIGIFSTKKSRDDQATTCRAIRAEAERLRYEAVDDWPKAIEGLRQRLPDVGDLKYETIREYEDELWYE